MPKPRARQPLAGAVGLAEEAPAAPPPAVGIAGSADSDSAPSEPPSPVLQDGHGSTSDADSLLGWKAASGGIPASGGGIPASGGGSSGSGSGGAGTCRLAGGPTAEERAESKRVQRRLLAALLLALAFMAAEVAGGLWAHSLAILTDAAHLLSDSTGFLVAALAAAWAKRAAPSHFSFGYHRVEVLGALASVLAVWVVTANLLVEAVRRIITPEPVDGKVMFFVAVAGVGVNLLMMLVLGHHHHGLSSSGCCASGGAELAGAAHLPGGAGCAAGAACCVSPAQRWFLAAGPAVDLEMGGVQGSTQRQEEEEEAETVHSGLLPILAAAGYTQSSSSSDGGSLGSAQAQAAVPGGNAAAASGRRASRLSRHGPAGEGSPVGAAATAAAAQAGNLNLRGAVIHCIGDLVQSIGVCIAGALIWWHQDDPRWALADPICTFLFAALVLWTTAGISRDIVDVLMERAPRGVDLASLRQGMEQVPGVAAVTDLHVWALTPGIPLLSARVRLAKVASAGPVLQQLEGFCAAQGMNHCTIQPEQPS
ncbi:hypothetical protein ABPG75_000977 [Micractinium tetrahymenae]